MADEGFDLRFIWLQVYVTEFQISNFKFTHKVSMPSSPIFIL